MPGKGSFKLRKSKSEKSRPRPIVVEQREVENMRRFLNAKKDDVAKNKTHENVHKSMPASIDKTEELVEYPGGKYKRPILRKGAKPVDQTRRSVDNIKQLTGDKVDLGSTRKENERPKSMPPGSTKPTVRIEDTNKEGKAQPAVKSSAGEVEEVLEWPPDHWNRSPGKVQPDEFITRSTSLDLSAEDQTLVESRRLESCSSTPQQPRPSSYQQKQPPTPTPPATPPMPPQQQKQQITTKLQQHRVEDKRQEQTQQQHERTTRPRSDINIRVAPRTTPHAGPAGRDNQRRYTQLPEEMLMSRSFDLGEIEHHRRRALSVGDQKKNKQSYDSPDSGWSERQNIATKNGQERRHPGANVLRPKPASNRHAKSVMELKDWERYWDQYQRKQYAQYKNVSNPPQPNAGGGLRVTNPADLQRNGKQEPVTKAPTPRRHTVTVGGMDLEMGQRANQKLERQRDKFLDHLANRYPEHADVIKSKQGPLYGKLGRSGRKGSTSSEQNPSAVYASDSDDMMDDDDGGFLRRGGRLRSSLPVVRSPNKSTEKPLGLVFLIYRNETKRALLPNEVTSVDTIRALFVRAFPDALSMQYLESKKRKIYIMDQATNVYYELEDMNLKDVKDRTVLKVYETDVHGVPPSPSRSPKVRGSRSSAMYNSGHESDSSTRSAPAGVPRSPLHHHRQYNDMPNKVHSLPVQPTYVYHQQMQQYASQYGNMGHQGMGSPTHYRGGQNHSNNNSPSRVPPMHNNLPPNQRHSLAFIPDTNSAGAPYPPVTVGIPQSRSYNDYYDVDPSRSGSATPTGSEYESRQRIDKMEAQLANLTALVQTQAGMRPGAAMSNSSLVSDTASAKSSLSDLSSATPTPGPEISIEFQNKLRTLHSKAKEMKLEVRTLRRVQIDNMNIMKDTINVTFRQIKDLLAHTPGARDLPVRFQRSNVNNEMQMYTDHTSRVDRDLRDLEAAVEELRSDVLNKRCRVNPSEIETMALALSNVSKALADLKGRFPTLQENMKSVMAGEMEVVVKEEKLSSVQEKRPITQPHLTTNQQPAQEDKRAILENIQSIVPNHDARLQGVEAAEAARERKKRLVHNGEALRFEKSLEMAQKQLRETNGGTNIKQEADPTTKANIPLTETTKRLSQQERTNGESGGATEPASPTKSRDGYDINTAGLPHAPVPAGVTQTPVPPGVSASYIPTPHVGGITSPSKLNQPATSTPVSGQKAQAHVTFSDSVIEITDNPIGAEGGESGKKVPPPPPPRKSSRTTFKNLSPTHGQPKRPFSPPAYENIENLNINTSAASDGSNSSVSKQQTAYNRSVSAPTSGSAPQGAISQPGAQYHAPKQKPMSKFQQELAAGIYANMNRPDLQGQKLNPAAVVSNPNTIKEESQARDFSDNESTTSNQDSQAGLARKMLAAKLDEESPSNLKQQSPPRLDDSTTGTNGVKMREGKKVPPPPPVRRTSQLSSKPDNNDSITMEEKRRSVSELQKEIMQQMERQGSNPSAAPSGDHNSTTTERNGVLPNQQHKHLTNGDIIRTDASFAVNTRTTSSTVTTITNQHKVTNIHVLKQSGKKNETDIY